MIPPIPKFNKNQTKNDTATRNFRKTNCTIKNETFADFEVSFEKRDSHQATLFKQDRAELTEEIFLNKVKSLIFFLF